ncbi:hypothetical protein FIM61_06890 [Helicobacter pylori]|nr:hypothetical protein FIM61_06890 [Helicobacter pylori]
MLFTYYIKISPFNPLIDTNPFFYLILIKRIFMIKSKIYQAISWPLAGVLSHFYKFLKIFILLFTFSLSFML